MPVSKLVAVARSFRLHGSFGGAVPFGQGHINDTFVVTIEECGAPVRYVLQRINHRIFKDVPALMENIQRVTAHAAWRIAGNGGGDVTRRVLTLLSADDDRPYHLDDEGCWWRCYAFIEGTRTYDIIENPRQAAEAARAFGEFQNLLADLPGGRLHETIPFFHHTRRRFDHLIRVVEADACNRAAQMRDEIAFALAREPMVDVLLDLQARGEIPERITHNDTKLNNILFDDTSQAGLCVIDLDTVMPGLALYDFGDMVRSGTNAAAEDEPDLSLVQARLPVFEALVKGYLSAARSFLNDAEIAHLAFSGSLITFEMGLRFLADFIEGDVYYKTQRPGQNRDRARNQFALVRSLEVQQDAMEKMVRKHAVR